MRPKYWNDTFLGLNVLLKLFLAYVFNFLVLLWLNIYELLLLLNSTLIVIYKHVT